MRHQSLANDFVFAIDGELAVLQQAVSETPLMFDDVHLAGVVRNHGRQIHGPDHRDPVVHDSFARTRQLRNCRRARPRYRQSPSRCTSRSTISAVIRMGAFLPGTAAVVITTSCSRRHFRQQLALAAIELLVHRFGVAALVFAKPPHRHPSTTNFAPTLSTCSFTAGRTS